MQGKTPALRALFLGGCLATLPLSLALAQVEMDFTAAKSAADADEASLDAATSAAALEQQRAFLDARVAACANIRTTAQLEDFVVEVKLDASGRVTNTWCRGDSTMALCIERDARRQEQRRAGEQCVRPGGSRWLA